MPSFLRDFRRRSKSSVKTDFSSNESNPSTNGNGSVKNKSSSTLSSFIGSAPSSTMLPERSKSVTNLLSPTNGMTPPPVPPRPPVVSSQSNRYSIIGIPTNGTQSKSAAATSPLAPRVLNVSDNSWVHQKVFLLFGEAGDPQQQPVDGTLVICHHQDSYPPTTWPVCDSYFKALVHLQSGPNRIRLDFFPPRPQPQNGSTSAHSTWISINSLPLNSSPPIQLGILVAKDSPQTFDATPERVQREGNGLQLAIRKFRMAAYLWQAFTGEQMNRSGFGRRCYRYEEEWQPGTLTYRDADTGTMRNEAKIHIIPLNKTVKEIRDLDIAQQYDKAKNKGGLYDIAMDAVRGYFAPRPGQTQYVSCMYLDSHWDTKQKVIRGHAALGGGAEGVQLAIFGSHSLQSYPASIEDVVPAFMDCTKTDTNFVANDCNDAGSNWEAVNIGIGAHLHETGHLLGCPHQESGVMLRDYVRLNRTFVCREPPSTRTKSPGQRLYLQHDECNWHRLDCLRFRYHPCFRLPPDPPNAADESVQVWSVENGSVFVTSAAGIAWIELYTEGDDLCRQFIEYVDHATSNPPPRQITLTESDLRSRLPSDRRNKKLKLEIFPAGQGKHTVEDLSQLSSRASRIKLPDGRWAFRGSKLGASQLDGSQPQEVLLEPAYIHAKLLTSIKVYHGFCVDGIEFVYEDKTTQLFGKRGGKPGGSEFSLDTRRGETLMGFYMRSGLWIDGLQILTSLGRRSELYGNPTGGSGHTLIPPRGYTIAGVTGSCGAWLDGFALVITR